MYQELCARHAAFDTATSVFLLRLVSASISLSGILRRLVDRLYSQCQCSCEISKRRS